MQWWASGLFLEHLSTRDGEHGDQRDSAGGHETAGAACAEELLG